ncbi:hypothetical protein ATANTOWER_000051, partial [Ataeniobius toweri]|nr:hypothetical protein [Ataeniobius toweri]
MEMEPNEPEPIWKAGGTRVKHEGFIPDTFHMLEPETSPCLGFSRWFWDPNE